MNERRIWKYKLQVTDDQFIEMPRGAQALSVQMQGSEPTMWASVDPEREPINVHVKIVSTGAEYYPSDMDFVGTFQMGWFVGHVFIGATS